MTTIDAISPLKPVVWNSDASQAAAELLTQRYANGYRSEVLISFRDGGELCVPDQEMMSVAIDIDHQIMTARRRHIVPDQISADDFRGLLLCAWMYHRKQC